MTPLGDCLETFRRLRQIHQIDLADYLCVSRCYISALEKGRKVPSNPEVVRKIAEKLALNDRETDLLFDSLEKSKQTWKVPIDTGLKEYAFLHALWSQLGSLSEKQLQGMHLFLEMQAGEQRINK